MGVRIGEDRLTDQERAFLLEWLVDGNGTRAAMVVYNCKSLKVAEIMASRILARKRVRKALQKLLDSDPDRIKLRKKDILKSLSDSMNRDLHDLAKVCPAVKDLPRQTHSYVSRLDVEEFHEDPEHPRMVTKRQVRIGMSPIAEDRALAAKIRGMITDKSVSMAGTPSQWEQFLENVERVLGGQEPIRKTIERNGDE